MAGNGFAISVKLIDFASGPLAKVNQSIAAVEKTAKKAAREGGLFEARDALKKMRESADAVADKLGAVFTPLAGLGAAGTLAGMVSLAEGFARTGTAVARASSLFGVGARDLQNWQGAMRLAGGSAEEATGLIANVGRQLYLARNGLNPQIARGASQFGLDINKSDTEFLLDAADKLRSLAPQQRRQFAQVFGIDENSLFLLSKGREEVERYITIAKRHGYLTGEQVRSAYELNFAWQGLKESVESTGNAIGGDIGKWLTPMLKNWSDWLDDLRESPGAMKTVETGVDLLAFAVGTTLVGSFAKLIAVMNAWWALPAMRFLLSPAGAAMTGIGAFIWGMWPKTTNEGEAEAVKKGLKAPTQEEVDRNQNDIQAKPKTPMLWDWLKGKFSSAPAAYAPIPPAAASPAAVGAPGPQAPHIIATARAAGASDEAITAMLAGAIGEGGLHETWKPGDHGSSFGPWQLKKGGELNRYLQEGNAPGDIAAQTKFVLQRLNEIHPGFSKMNDPVAATRVIKDFEKSVQGYDYYLNNVGDAANIVRNSGTTGGGISGKAIGELGALDKRTKDMLAAGNRPPGFPMDVFNSRDADLAAAGRPPLTGVPGERRLPSGTLYNSRGEPYSRDLLDMPPEEQRRMRERTAAWKAATQRGDQTFLGPSEGGTNPKPYGAAVESAGAALSNAADRTEPADSTHHVEVQFKNAPAGMRSGLTRADGPASVSVRTQHALDMVY